MLFFVPVCCIATWLSCVLIYRAFTCYSKSFFYYSSHVFEFKSRQKRMTDNQINNVRWDHMERIRLPAINIGLMKLKQIRYLIAICVLKCILKTLLDCLKKKSLLWKSYIIIAFCFCVVCLFQLSRNSKQFFSRTVRGVNVRYCVDWFSNQGYSQVFCDSVSPFVWVVVLRCFLAE